MSSLFHLRHRVFIGLALLQPFFIFAQVSDSGISPVVGDRSGDQVGAKVVLGSRGGYVVWQDSLIDQRGFGIAAVRLNSSLVSEGEVFRVNVSTPESQLNPQLALLKNGGCVFVWQGGKPGAEDVFLRIRGSSGAWLTGDLFANTYRKNSQVDPAVACLNKGSVVVLWSSAGQDGSLMGIYGQRFSAAGGKIGGEFRVNQFTDFNQRNASIAALPNGGFVAAWISEQQRSMGSRDVYARVFTPEGRAAGNEFLINAGTNQCSSPVLAALSDGFAVVWTQFPGVSGDSSPSDIVSRVFNLDGGPRTGAAVVSGASGAVNKTPAICIAGQQFAVLWSRQSSGPAEKIYGRFVASDNTPQGETFLASSGSLGRKVNPALAGDDTGRVMGVWSEYVFGGPGFDLLGKILR